MYTSMLGAAAFMDWTGGFKTAAGIAWFAAGGIIGWPFAMALAVPFLLEEALLAVTALGNLDQFLLAIRRVTRGVLAAVGIIVSISDRISVDVYLTGPGRRFTSQLLFLQGMGHRRLMEHRQVQRFLQRRWPRTVRH